MGRRRAAALALAAAPWLAACAGGATLLGAMNRGLADLERYDYAGAAEEFRQASEIDPSFYPARFNHAVALVNNQSEPAAAEEALRAAAALAPAEAGPPYMLGILLTQGVSPPRTAEALECFRRAAALAPGDADCRFRIGLALKEGDAAVEAEREFSLALELNPFLGAALYQRGLTRNQLDREEEAAEDLRRFQELEGARRVDAREISYGFMGPLGNAVRDLDRWLPPQEPARFDPAAWAEEDGAFLAPADPGGTLAIADLDGDGLPDLAAGAAAGWRKGLGCGRFGPAVPWAGFAAGGITPFTGGDVAAADFDSDGTLDVALDEPVLLLGAAGAEARPVPLPGSHAPRGRRLAADLDADGDVDLVAGRAVLLNDGRAGLAPSPFPVDLPPEPWEPLLLRDVDDDGFPDLVGRDSWVRNLRGGSFGGEKALPEPLGGAVRDLADRKVLAFGDFDGDGRDEPAPAEGARAAVPLDADGDGDLDLVVARAGRLLLRRNDGDSGPRMLHLELAGVLHPNGRQFGWTNPRGLGVRAEAITGRRRVTRWMGLDLCLDGKPDPGVAAFGLGKEGRADLVSLRWCEGVIQAEPDVAARAGRKVRIEEVQRKAASCPVVFAWDGEKFAFVADCMGGGGLGFLVAPGTYGPPDPTERVRIPPGALREREGFYEVRLAEPLEEACFADRLSLVAVDHAADAEAYPDERFGGTGAPPGERVFVHRRAEQVLPVRALDGRGRDVADRLARTDRVYAEGFELHRDLLGFTAADHWIDLDFAGRVPALREGERLVLFLDGWIEYGYSRTFYAAAGAKVAPLSPTLEVADGRGGWLPGIPDVGYPAGTPRTMTRDVTGVVTPGRPRFRVRTNLEIRWDRAWLAVDRGEGALVRTAAAPAEASLRFVGFPREVSPDGRLPKLHDYRLLDRSVRGFKALRGAYTRFGDVRPLLADADDRYVVFRNGEEIALRFRASDFPPPREGRARTFLLETTGWCKDMDPYTFAPETLEPLPFLGMTAYPPPPGEAFPDDPASREWRRTYNTRVVR